MDQQPYSNAVYVLGDNAPEPGVGAPDRRSFLHFSLRGAWLHSKERIKYLRRSFRSCGLAQLSGSERGVRIYPPLQALSTNEEVG